MKAGRNRSPDEIRERYLGEIAPLLEAARNLESLSPAQKKHVRRRVLRTVFGGRGKLFRFRLTPVMVAVGLLVAGGVAFATAERLGLIHRPDQGPPNLKTSDGDTNRRKNLHPKRGSQPEAAARQPTADWVLPSVPDPLLTVPLPAPPELTPLAPEALADSRPGDAHNTQSPTASGARSPAQKPPRAADPPMAQATPVVPVSPASAFAIRPAQPVRKVALATPYLAEPMATPPPAAVDRRLAPLPAPTATYSSPAPLPAPATIVPPVVQPRAAPVVPVPAVAPVSPAAKPVASDPVLFGQALRKLRNEDDPAAALAALEQHAQAYPRSAFSGERSALEVEALLALRRDREALQKLDGMNVEKLPRSGERLVVRGELRAAARRWLDAKEDFDRALSRVSGSPAWHERALWGRGVARLRCGEREAGMEDIERYHDLYPKGRFAAEASRFFPNK
jgi:hypothetical protein